MQFALAHYPVPFEIPDEWWIAAGMPGFAPSATAFSASPDDEYPSAILPITEIKPPTRNPGVPWFGRDRMIEILTGIRAGQALPPVPVHEVPDQREFRYALQDGFHRFYASIAAGFTHLPVVIRPYVDINRI